MAKKQNRKPRTDYIYATTAAEVDHLIVNVDGRTGSFSFGNEVTDVYSETSYERTKGPKVVSRVPQSNRALTFDVDTALKRDYDFICAVDTNTKFISGRQVSAIGVITVRSVSIPAPSGLQVFWKFEVPVGGVLFNVKVDKPENLSWLIAHEQLVRIGSIENQMRVGMIVDSDLRNINHYNEKRSAVLLDRMLPDGVRLIYASADTGKDSILNKALSVADSASSQMLAAVEDGRIAYREEPEHPFYEGFQLVVPSVVSD